jgi:uncharacterized repeat protein (TIGR01451 family)
MKLILLLFISFGLLPIVGLAAGPGLKNLLGNLLYNATPEAITVEPKDLSTLVSTPPAAHSAANVDLTHLMDGSTRPPLSGASDDAGGWSMSLPTKAIPSEISQAVGSGCRPTYINDCREGDGLVSFSLNNIVLSENSGCSTDGYSLFDVTSGTVVAGQTYSLFGQLMANNVYAQGVTIWADLNRNGLFETSQGERLYQNASVLTSFSGNIPLPTSLTPGPLAIRVVVAYNLLPADPCGTYLYGETEDYVVNVVKAADLSMTFRTSQMVTALNQPLSYSVTLKNNGPSNATGISWLNRLPSNLSFVTGNASVVNSGTAVGVSNLSLVSGSSVTFTYQLKADQEGLFINTAQITASNEFDPDSQPDSGTEDGQDDTALASVRTLSAKANIFTSPNPNQTPLPSVLSNQPTPHPAKADLSLAMVTSQRTLGLGQAISCTLTISNAGGMTATNIVVRDTLKGLTFTASPSGIGVVSTGNDYTIIEGTVASLGSGAVTQLIFTATPTVSGRIINVAQIWSCGTPDPDSTPGSVTPTANNVNGEDDVTWIDLRVSVP